MEQLMAWRRAQPMEQPMEQLMAAQWAPQCKLPKQNPNL